METVRAKIMSENRVVADNVLIHFQISVSSPSGLKSWRGNIETDNFLEVGAYRLFLVDGREGNIIINHVNIGSRGTFVQFVGSGPLEKPES